MQIENLMRIRILYMGSAMRLIHSVSFFSRNVEALRGLAAECLFFSRRQTFHCFIIPRDKRAEKLIVIDAITRRVTRVVYLLLCINFFNQRRIVPIPAMWSVTDCASSDWIRVRFNFLAG